MGQVQIGVQIANCKSQISTASIQFVFFFSLPCDSAVDISAPGRFGSVRLGRTGPDRPTGVTERADRPDGGPSGLDPIDRWLGRLHGPH